MKEDMKKIDTTTLSVPFVDGGKNFEHMIITGPTRTGMSASAVVPGLLDLFDRGHAGGVTSTNQATVAEAPKKVQYVLKTIDGYLYPRDGDVGWTPDFTAAGRFDSQDAAEDTASVNGYEPGDFEVIPVHS